MGTELATPSRRDVLRSAAGTTAAALGSAVWFTTAMAPGRFAWGQAAPGDAVSPRSGTREFVPGEVAPGGPQSGVLADGSTESTWRIGAEVTAPGGMRGLTLSFPVPMEWPDQAVTEVERIVEPPSLSLRDAVLGGGAKLLTVTASVVPPGSTCRVVLTVTCRHPAPALPEDVERLVRPTDRTLRPYLIKGPGIETDHRLVRAAADDAISAEDAKARPAWTVARTIYDYVRETIRYEFDPTLRGAAAAIERKVGDCEELTSLFIAICRLRGIPARSVWIPGHTYPEFCLADENGVARWYACQAAGSDSFGFVVDSRPILQKGDSFVVPGGGSRPVRYVAPVLQALDVGRGSPTLAMIAEPVAADGTSLATPDAPPVAVPAERGPAGRPPVDLRATERPSRR